MSTPRSFSLYELVSSVRRCIESSFTDKYWIRAESSDVRTAGGSGHCYLELLEKDEAHNIKAKVRANIWRQNYQMISERFRKAGLPPLASEMNILCLVQVQYHEQYGLSLVIHDIDPNYSLGEIARLRRETIERLKREGVMEANKSLPLPRPLQRLAIISSPTAAGYGDFMNQLKGNSYGFKYYTALFSAQMQGDRTTSSVISALERIARHADAFDAVVIIRGGGAVSELRAFDSYDLCYFCTQYPLPILSGIGHERDVSVLDMVAHTSLKTPTAVAEYLIHSLLKDYTDVELRMERITARLNLQQTEWHRKLREQSIRIPSVSRRFLAGEALKQSRLRERLILGGRDRLNAVHRKSEQTAALLGYHLRSSLQRAHQHTDEQQLRLVPALRQQQVRYEGDLQRREQALRLLHPDNILKRGFAVVRREGELIMHSDDLSAGDRVEIQIGVSKLSATVN